MLAEAESDGRTVIEETCFCEMSGIKFYVLNDLPIPDGHGSAWNSAAAKAHLYLCIMLILLLGYVGCRIVV